MRLLRLGLVRFGPFTDAQLDFSAAPAALHVIHGPNEAGKSTALRALSGLLFGIPERTDDGHVHPLSQLLLAARLEVEGRTLVLSRKKGRKNTLLDEAGQPLDEGLLGAALRGVTRESFESAFALDGKRLRDGGHSLTEGSADTGQVLFDASSGGVAVERVKATLEGEAAEIFKPGRASKPLLNERLAQHKELREGLKNSITSPEAFARQESELRARLAEKASVERRLRELRIEQARLGRAKIVLPSLRRREQCLERLAGLGRVAGLPLDLERRHRQIEERERAADGEVRVLAQRIARAEERLESLGGEDDVLSLPSAELDRLADWVGRERKARADLPKVRQQLADKTQEVGRALARLELSSIADVERLLLSPQRNQTLSELATKRPPELEELRAELREAEARLAEAVAAVEGLGAAQDCGELERRLQRASRQGDLDASVSEMEAEVQRRQRGLQRELKALRPWEGDADTLRGLALPASESLREYAQQELALDSRAARLEERKQELEGEADAADLELTALLAERDVPSEAMLDAARADRDRALALLLDEPETPRADGLAGALRDKVRAADELADRLRREADRVQLAAKYQTTAERARRELKRIAEERRELERARDALRHALQQHLACAGILLPSVREAQGWLERAHASRLDAEASFEMRDKLSTQQRRRDEEVAALGALLVEDLSGLSLADASERAQAALARRRTAQAKRERAESLRDGARTRLEDAQRRLDRAERTRASWQQSWREVTSGLGLGELPAPELTLTVLREAQVLAVLESERSTLERRVSGMERDSKQLRDLLCQLEPTAAPSRSASDELARADGLLERVKRARTTEARRAELGSEVADAKIDLAYARERLAEATRELDELLAESGAASRSELSEVEAAIAERSATSAELAQLEGALMAAGDGLTMAQLMEETRSLSPEDVRARLAEIESELEENLDKREALAVDISDIEGGRARLSADAAERLEKTQASAAEIRALCERWLRLRLASVVLGREVERFRHDNQGPMLARGSELFAELTGQRYVELRSELGDSDRPTLRAVRHDGVSLAPKQLSEGTADQLYLALRLAAYELHLREGTCLPLVLDDVLASFDDERARSTLQVLAKVAAGGQVLLFTHHEFVVREASETLGAGVHVHRLQKPSAGQRAGVAASPLR